jgi:hypothetical protein
MVPVLAKGQTTTGPVWVLRKDRPFGGAPIAIPAHAIGSSIHAAIATTTPGDVDFARAAPRVAAMRCDPRHEANR